MGTLDGPRHETPVHVVEIQSFFMDRAEVTVGDFGKFVEATGYKTEAESIGWSGVFDPEQHRWGPVKEATWRHPDGPAHPAASASEPVTQVSWNDAQAYAKWTGKRLPTEAEWEYAARGGVDQSPYVWGRELRPGGHPVANWWQGSFPEKDTGEDGFRGRAPVGRFAPNAFGLVDVIGNVWEWCADWYGEHYYAQSPRPSPSGPATGVERVMRGGAWMCSENYCTNYRPGARSHATPDTGLNNTGFRFVRDISRNNVEVQLLFGTATYCCGIAKLEALFEDSAIGFRGRSSDNRLCRARRNPERCSTAGPTAPTEHRHGARRRHALG